VTGNLAIDLVISLVGIMVLVGISYLLGAMRSVIITSDAALDRLAFDEPDFRPGFSMIGEDGKAAAIIAADDRETAVVFAVGDGVATRRFRHGAVSLEKHGAVIEFVLNEPSKRAVQLRAADSQVAEEWLLRLAGPTL